MLWIITTLFMLGSITVAVFAVVVMLVVGEETKSPQASWLRFGAMPLRVRHAADRDRSVHYLRTWM